MDELPGLAFSPEAAMDRDSDGESFRGFAGKGRLADIRGSGIETLASVGRRQRAPLETYLAYMRDNLERARAYTRIPSLYE